MKHPRAASPPTVSRAERFGEGADTVDLLGGEDALAGVALVRSRLGPGRDGAPPHHHEGITERFCVLVGELEVLAGDEVLVLEAGEALTVPPGVVHAFGARAGRSADVLVAFTPGEGRADYFRVLDRVRRGLADASALTADAQRFDTHFTTSVAWSTHRDAR